MQPSKQFGASSPLDPLAPTKSLVAPRRALSWKLIDGETKGSLGTGLTEGFGGNCGMGEPARFPPRSDFPEFFGEIESPEFAYRKCLPAG